METINPKTAINTTFPLTVKADRPDLVHIPLSECGATAEIGHAFRTN